MANALLGIGNHIDSTYNGLVIFGGAWDAVQNLGKLIDEDPDDPAISLDATNASTQYFVDLGVPADITLFFIPKSNASLSGKHRLSGSNTPMWSGLVATDNSHAGDGSILMLNTGITTQNISAGDLFSIKAASGVNYTYKSGSDMSIAPGDAESIPLDGDTTYPLQGDSLAADAPDGTPISCNMGDFSSPLVFFDWSIILPRIYPVNTLPYGHPSWATGRPTEEQRLTIPFPMIEILPNFVNCRYWHHEIDDTTNPEGVISLSRLYLGRSYQASHNLAPGDTKIDLVSGAVLDQTIGGRRVVNDERPKRRVTAAFKELPSVEAFSNLFDLQWLGGLKQQVVFIFDPDDVELMHRRSFLATVDQLSSIDFPYAAPDINNATVPLLEV